MARYTVAGYYRLIVSQDPERYVVDKGFESEQDTVTSDSSMPVFNVGDIVHVVGAGYDAQATIVAFTTDGVVVVDQYNAHTLLTSNDGYLDGAVLDINTDPFAVCFVKGTLIDTERGTIPIEGLAVGDKVVGRSGLRTVRWIGWRQYHAIALRTADQRLACTPVRILAGALGEHQPDRDLRVSPWHHLYIDSVLVRAKDLSPHQGMPTRGHNSSASCQCIELSVAHF